jgi:SAM-dependent methyltransferase
MTRIDVMLQRWRTRKAVRFIPEGGRVIDVGCSNALLYHSAPGLRAYVGIDPEPRASSLGAEMQIIKGSFPRDAPVDRRFDAITALATFEHIPPEEQPGFVQACFDRLDPGGVVILTVPDPLVDRILDVLEFLRLVEFGETHQHYGYQVSRTPEIFARGGFTLLHRSRFQLGLNNLFVFSKQGTDRPRAA